MIFGMYQEMFSFLVVFLMSVLGFGIAFHSLFPDIESFNSPGATVLTLFDAALGGHEFQSFQGHKYQDVGIVAMSLYIVFAVIILMNLIIARMSSAHEAMNEKSFELWSMVMANNIEGIAFSPFHTHSIFFLHSLTHSLTLSHTLSPFPFSHTFPLSLSLTLSLSLRKCIIVPFTHLYTKSCIQHYTNLEIYTRLFL